MAGKLTCDPVRLTQVFRNLIRNSVAHTVSGDAIVVDARPGADRLQISVRDTGEGIPSTELERIFQRFSRLPSAAPDRLMEDQARGGGLGLPIARAIVEAHGGRIWAEPSIGGALIRVDLPGYQPVTPARIVAEAVEV